MSGRTTSEQDQINRIKNNLRVQKTIWVKKETPPFDADFITDKQLGEPGQFGVTHRCIRKSDRKQFAVKKINKNRFYRIVPEKRYLYLQAMKNEIEILENLNHAHVIKLHYVYEDKPTLYLVMEECTGGELFARIVQRGHYTESDAARVIKQILEALKYMHEVNNIVHCDLKPDNILFLHKGEDSPIKIIDFGMSAVLPRLHYLTQLVGTPYYTAPEVVATKNPKFNHACDCWSVGVIMYVMIFGYPPFYVDPTRYSYGKQERKAIYGKIGKGFIPEIRDTEKYGFGPWFPSHIPVSEQAMDLITKLLTFDVDKRCAAGEALNHPWIQKLGGNAKDPIPRHILTSLASFSSSCEFKKVIVKLFRDQFQKMRPAHFLALEEIFKKMDTNNDGVITYEEFEKAIVGLQGLKLEQKHIKEMFDELADKNRGICFEHLLDALVHDYLVARDERLYAAFRELDDDDDGKITTKQLELKLRELDNDECERAINIKLIEQQSLLGNGDIDYAEFLVNLHPSFDEKPQWIEEIYKMTSVVAEEEESKEDI